MTTPGFIRGIAANLTYWQDCLEDLTDERIRQLNADHANLQEAVAFGLAWPETRLAAANLVLRVFPLVERCGYWSGWIPTLQQVIACLPEVDRQMSFDLWKRLGQLLRFNSQLDEAIAAHKTAERLAVAWGERQSMADALMNLSEDYRHYQAYDQAETYGKAALAELDHLPEATRWRMATLNTLGLVAHAMGNAATAERYLKEAIMLGQADEQPTYQARLLNNLAMALQAQTRYEAALVYYQEAIILLDGTASELDKSRVHLSLGSLYFERGELDQAFASFQQADSIVLRQSGDIYTRAVLAQNLGNVRLKQGCPTEAVEHLQRGLVLWRQIEQPLMLANTLGTLAEAMAAQGRPKEALSGFDEALALLSKYPNIAWAKKLHAAFTAERAEVGLMESPPDHQTQQGWLRTNAGTDAHTVPSIDNKTGCQGKD